MKRTIKTLGLFLSAFFLLTGCSSDDESGIEPKDVIDQGEYSEKYNLTLFDQPPYVFNMQSEKKELSSSLLNDLTPQTQPLYDLLVVPNDDEGRDIIKKLTDETDGIAVNIRNWSEYDAKKGYRITSKKYFESPHLYVSVNFKMRDMEQRGYVVHVMPILTIKMNRGYDIKTIGEKYDLTYVHTTGNNMWYDYSCNVRNAYEAIKLAEKIQLQPEVEWAHVNCSGTAWVD